MLHAVKRQSRDTYLHLLGSVNSSEGRDWQQQGHLRMRRSEDGTGGLGNSVSAAMKEICDCATVGVYFLDGL